MARQTDNNRVDRTLRKLSLNREAPKSAFILLLMLFAISIFLTSRIATSEDTTYLFGIPFENKSFAGAICAYASVDHAGIRIRAASPFACRSIRSIRISLGIDDAGVHLRHASSVPVIPAERKKRNACLCKIQCAHSCATVNRSTSCGKASSGSRLITIVPG